MSFIDTRTNYDPRNLGDVGDTRVMSGAAAPANPQQDLFTSRNPRGSVRPFFGQLGYAQESGNPWVDYYSQRIAPGLGLLHAAQNPYSMEARGFADYMRNQMAAGIGGSVPSAAAPSPGWMTYRDFGNTLRSVIGPGSSVQSGTALYGALGPTASPEDQVRSLGQLLNTGASMTMTGLAQQGMLSDLQQKAEVFAGLVNTGALGPVNSFRDWLAGTDFYDRWFGGVR